MDKRGQRSTLPENIDKPVLPVRSTSKNMLEVERNIRQVASGDQSVLVVGETGTGKDEVAQAIHRESPRASHPFIAVNCAAIPETLLEDAMFGHEKGAFSGATSLTGGYFEQAHGGTLFLDEVGDMSSSTQAKILRAIQDKTIRRVGGTKLISVDIRVIAATNKNLGEEITKERFREDLYYRLAEEEIILPPLRARKEDLPALIGYFLKNSSLLRRNRNCIFAISDTALEILLRYHWPGNIRQLMSVLGRAVTRCPCDTILPEHLTLLSPNQHSTEDGNEDPGMGLVQTKNRKIRITRDSLLSALEKSNWKAIMAAQLLKCSSRTVYRQKKKYGLKRSENHKEQAPEAPMRDTYIPLRQKELQKEGPPLLP